MTNSGYVLIDMEGLDVSDTGTETKTGIYSKVVEALNKGKNAILTNVYIGTQPITPTAASTTIDELGVVEIMTNFPTLVNRLTITSDDSILKSEADSGGGGGNNPFLIVGLEEVDITAQGLVQDLSELELYDMLKDTIMETPKVIAVMGLFGDSSSNKRISCTPVSAMIDGEDICLYVCASASITKIIIDSASKVYVGTKETT